MPHPLFTSKWERTRFCTAMLRISLPSLTCVVLFLGSCCCLVTPSAAPVFQGGAKTLEEIEQELLRNSSESAVAPLPNGESVPVLTVDQLERKLRGQTETDAPPSFDAPPSSTPRSTRPLAAPSDGPPVTRIPGLLPIVPGSISVQDSVSFITEYRVL